MLLLCSKLTTFLLLTTFALVNASSKKELLYQTKFPPCRACKTFVESFKRGMDRTARGKFEGGDAAWEEEKLRSYSESEIRLVEIQESVCSDVQEGRDQCYFMNEQHDGEIEEWWFKHQKQKPDLFEYLCIEKIKTCCPDKHYGTNCLPCPGYPDNICSGNGKCKGNGTRKGNGKCNCDSGYKGDICDSCADNFFAAYQDDKMLICSKCHVACEGGCVKGGPTGCTSCAKGWLTVNNVNKDSTTTDSKESMTEDLAGNGVNCLDINECASSTSPCSPLQFCVNTEGSYNCLDCDRSCAGCSGDGPDMCFKCANGFTLVDNMCVDSAEQSRKQHVFLSRYLTYLGLCIATCIIFQRSFILAAIIGLAVAVYISVSEYILNSPPTPNQTDLAEKLLRAVN